jgi:hypothetical protein
MLTLSLVNEARKRNILVEHASADLFRKTEVCLHSFQICILLVGHERHRRLKLLAWLRNLPAQSLDLVRGIESVVGCCRLDCWQVYFLLL